MNIIFNENFNNSGYADNSASQPGRMEAIINEVKLQQNYKIFSCGSASEEQISLIHDKSYIEKIKKDKALYEMALLAAGGAVKAGEFAWQGNNAFACVRPPGHHAYVDFGWGMCVCSNVAVSLMNLKAQGFINSALVVDIDAHTGDGTKEVLKPWKEAICFNPMAEEGNIYLKRIKEFLSEQGSFDILAVSAGFDAYEKDLGKKLGRFDYYLIGRELSSFANKKTGGKRFAVLEGGYYLPDLGKNVVSFCDGFSK